MIERIPYAGWQDCLRLSNGRIEAVVTTEVGPRILRFGAIGGRNLLHEVPEHRGLKGGPDWRALGGHRLWHAPEAKPRTYAPDNDPVAWELQADRILLTQAVEPATGIRKELELRLEDGADRLHLTHRLRNLGPWPVELAPWAITMMAPGGVAIVPEEPFTPHPDFPAGLEGAPGTGSYLPARALALWSYTRLGDARLVFREDCLQIRQDPGMAAPLKCGMSNRQGWCAYVREGEALLKQFSWAEGARYPDAGCNNEFFASAEMLEMESLGPLVFLAPQACVAHGEVWTYASGVAGPGELAALRAALAPACG